MQKLTAYKWRSLKNPVPFHFHAQWAKIKDTLTEYQRWYVALLYQGNTTLMCGQPTKIV